MKTIQDAIEWGRAQLQPVVGDRATSETRLLLAHVCSLDVVDLITENLREIDSTVVEKFRELIGRRTQKEPVAYLVGEKEFFSLKLKVTKDVLIPRPETEKLVELALQLETGKKDLRVADLGTGSGCIAIALGKNRPHWKVEAFDISEEALAVAKENAEIHQVLNVQFQRHNLLKSRLNTQYDLIVSNPPYIPVGEKQNLQEDIRFFEPELALYGGEEGLDFYRALFSTAWLALKPKAWMILETHDKEQRHRLEAIEPEDLIQKEIVDCHCLFQKK